MKRKLLLLGSLLWISTLAACGMKADMTIRDGKIAASTMEYYLTKEELLGKAGSAGTSGPLGDFDPFEPGTPASADADMQGKLDEIDRVEIIGGRKYYVSVQDADKDALGTDVNSGKGAAYTKQYFAYDLSNNSETANKNTSEMGSVDSLTGLDFFVVTFRLDKAVKSVYALRDTDCKVQDSTVQINLLPAFMQKGRNIVYFVFDPAVEKGTPKLKGVTNKKSYKKNKVTVRIDNCLPKYVTIKRNGKKLPEKKLLELEGNCINTFVLSQEGKYNLTVKTSSGKTKSVAFNVDRTAPKVSGVKNGGVYSKAVKIKFSDKTAGVRKAYLNGKAIKSGAKVKKKGSYKLVVFDKAENKTTVRFKLK